MPAVEMAAVSEPTLRRYVAELRRRNDLDELALPAFYTLEQVSALVGLAAEAVRQQAADLLHYRPGRGRAWALTPDQVLGLKRLIAARAR